MARFLATTYADQAAQQAFEEDDGQEVEEVELVPGAVDEVLRAWLALVWVDGGTTEREGKGRGLVGHRRRLGSTGIVEEIVSAGLPRDPQEQTIASVAYRMLEPAPLLLATHRGFVRFVPIAGAQGPATLVVWGVKTAPSQAGGVLCCGGSIQRLLTRNSLQRELKALAARMRAEKPEC